MLMSVFYLSADDLFPTVYPWEMISLYILCYRCVSQSLILYVRSCLLTDILLCFSITKCPTALTLKCTNRWVRILSLSAPPHPHLEALHLSLVLSLLPSFALNQLENCENYLLRKISCLCCCYVNPLCDGLVERWYAVEVLIGSTNRIHFSTTDRWEYSALASCPS